MLPATLMQSGDIASVLSCLEEVSTVYTDCRTVFGAGQSFILDNFSVKTNKGGFRENTSLKSRLKTQGAVVQVLRAKKNIFLFALENRGTKNPETVVVSGFSGAISFWVAQHVLCDQKDIRRVCLFPPRFLRKTRIAYLSAFFEFARKRYQMTSLFLLRSFITRIKFSFISNISTEIESAPRLAGRWSSND